MGYTRAFVPVLLALCVAVAFSEVQKGGKKTLVLVDDLNIKSSHSKFFQSLEARGHTLTYFLADDSDLFLMEYGEFAYDNLVIFAPSVEEFGGVVEVRNILEFIDSGRNVLIAASDKISDNIRELANECGVDFDEEGTVVVDHSHFDESDVEGDHTLVLADNYSKTKVVLGGKMSTPVLFKGIGMAVEEDNSLIVKILSGSSYSYSANPNEEIKEYPQSAGKDTLLVTAMQARNSARVVFSGSLDLFSNRFFSSPVRRSSDGKNWDLSGNAKFASELTKWNFVERGLLRLDNVAHSLAGGEEQKVYRVKDELSYTTRISEWDGDKWVAYNADDVQLEFVMIDPYVRTTMGHDGNGVYSTTFTAPDVYGVFQFRVSYNKEGYTLLHHQTQVAVRPYSHNEFERFIPQAFPYYASSFSMMVGLFLFGIVFLYNGSN